MVLFSAAIKGIPAEILEAARVTERMRFQLFFSIMLTNHCRHYCHSVDNDCYFYFENIRRGLGHDGWKFRNKRDWDGILSTIFYLQSKWNRFGDCRSSIHRGDSRDGI